MFCEGGRRIARDWAASRRSECKSVTNGRAMSGGGRQGRPGCLTSRRRLPRACKREPPVRPEAPSAGCPRCGAPPGRPAPRPDPPGERRHVYWRSRRRRQRWEAYGQNLPWLHRYPSHCPAVWPAQMVFDRRCFGMPPAGPFRGAGGWMARPRARPAALSARRPSVDAG